MCKEYGISFETDRPYIGMASGTSIWLCYTKGNNHSHVEITKEEIDNNFIKEMINDIHCCEKEEVWYGRKEYDIQQYIYDMLQNRGIYVKNCGTYLLTNEEIDELNTVFDLGLEIPKDGVLAYHEWY